MIRGAIGHLDVAQIMLYAFFLFFAGLHLVPAPGRPARRLSAGIRRTAPSSPRLPVHSLAQDLSPRRRLDRESAEFPGRQRPINAVKVEPWPGAPHRADRRPVAGRRRPGSWNVRPDFAYKTFDGHDVVAPMRVATNYAVADGGGNPIGFSVIGADGKVAGTIKDIWVDRAESMVSYYEIGLTGGKSVLAPVHFCDVNFRARTVKITALTAEPVRRGAATEEPRRVTMQEEEKVAAVLRRRHALFDPARAEPLL